MTQGWPTYGGGEWHTKDSVPRSYYHWYKVKDLNKSQILLTSKENKPS